MFQAERAATSKTKTPTPLRNQQDINIIGLHLFVDGELWGREVIAGPEIES